MVVFENKKCFCSLSVKKSLIENCFICDLHAKFANDLKLNLKSEFENLKIIEKKFLADNLFDICEDCLKMAAIPQGAFVACKLREQQRERELLITRMKSGGAGTDSNFNNEKPEAKYNMPKRMLEYAPVKYNSKLMNSIWGLYNRYSPHNIKSNDDVEQHYFLQQPQAVAGYAIAYEIASAMESAKDWGFVDK